MEWQEIQRIKTSSENGTLTFLIAFQTIGTLENIFQIKILLYISYADQMNRVLENFVMFEKLWPIIFYGK